jgi:hypothetical protein
MRAPQADAMTSVQATRAKAEPGVRLRAILERGFGAYAFDAAHWQGPIAHDAATRLDALVLAIPPVSTPAAAAGIERLQALVADPAYQLR